MSDYKVGYGQPPRHTRFKKGVCPNPKGRGKRKMHPAASAVDVFRTTLIRYREGGKSKWATPDELTIKKLIRLARTGNVQAAIDLLRLRQAAANIVYDNTFVIKVEGSLL